jgi:hypothetical protein
MNNQLSAIQGNFDCCVTRQNLGREFNGPAFRHLPGLTESATVSDISDFAIVSKFSGIFACQTYTSKLLIFMRPLSSWLIAQTEVLEFKFITDKGLGGDKEMIASCSVTARKNFNEYPC